MSHLKVISLAYIFFFVILYNTVSKFVYLVSNSRRTSKLRIGIRARARACVRARARARVCVCVCVCVWKEAIIA